MDKTTGSSWQDVERRAAERLERDHLSLTGSRFEVLRRLHEQSRPVTVAELASPSLLRKLHRATLYRTVQTLEEVGLVKRIRFLREGEDRFELGDAVRPHHHHLVCEGCGDVQPVRAEPRRPKLPRGFRLRGHQLEFYGLCAGCAKGAA